MPVSRRLVAVVMADVVTAAGPPPRSIMVLPFGAPAGDVARALANSVRDANIVAPSLAALQKGKPLDERALAKEANVRYLVTGDVRPAGEDIAVTARLIDGTTAKQLASGASSRVRAQAKITTCSSLE